MLSRRDLEQEAEGARSVGVLFAIGSACFVVAPLPGFVELVGSAVDAAVFFAGSLFFTSAALLQALAVSDRLDQWTSTVQFAGTLFFNVSTFRALRAGLDAPRYSRLVWAQTLHGSICFLVAGTIAFAAVRGRSRRSTPWRMAAVNLAGCVAFAISAAASYVVPSTGSALDLAAANAWTALGALCFLLAALPLVTVPAAVR